MAGPAARGVRCRNRALFNNLAVGMWAVCVVTARMKGGWGLIAVAGLALAVLAPPSYAGTIYGCDTADGQRSYVSKRIKGARCKAVTSYRSAPAPVRRPASVSSGGGSTVPASAHANPPATFMGGAGSGAGASAPAATATPVTSGAPTRRLQQGQVYSYSKGGVRHCTRQPPRGGGASAVRTIRYSFF